MVAPLDQGAWMGQDRTVVVTGGGKNLYRISEYDGWFFASQLSVGLISTTSTKIGRTRSLEDALDLIKSHSGRGIEEIR